MLDLAEDRALALSATVGSFARDGFTGPVPLLQPRECELLLAHLTSPRRPGPVVWKKGGAPTDSRLSRLGAHSRLLATLSPILGRDIVLWGTNFVRRKPGQVHTWHVDEETASPTDRFVTAWIGLHNTTGQSGIRMIAGSHLCPTTLDEFLSKEGVSRADLSVETLLEWAKRENPEARVAEPELGDGEAILFDGRIWHGSQNRLTDQSRCALILHFASADTAVRIPAEAMGKRAPAILVQGHAKPGVNWIVPPPLPPAVKRLERLVSSVRPIGLPLAERPTGGWQPYPLFRGSTPVLETLSCHTAVLSPGHSPHPPHSHQDEELLIVLDGKAELLIAERPTYDGARAVSVQAGDFAYYRALQHHTIRNRSAAPVTYMMFRWHGRVPAIGRELLRSKVFRSERPREAIAAQGFAVQKLFEGPTRWLGKLHCHQSRLAPGAGYAAHADAYDVAILIRSGRVETLGIEAGPGTVIHYPKGELHGMRNVGEVAAHYLVFEFHEPQRPKPSALPERGKIDCILSAALNDAVPRTSNR